MTTLQDRAKDVATAAVIAAMSVHAINTVLDILDRERVLCWRCNGQQVVGFAATREDYPSGQKIFGVKLLHTRWAPVALLCDACCHMPDEAVLGAPQFATMPFGCIMIIQSVTTHLVTAKFIRTE